MVVAYSVLGDIKQEQIVLFSSLCCSCYLSCFGKGIQNEHSHAITCHSFHFGREILQGDRPETRGGGTACISWYRYGGNSWTAFWCGRCSPGEPDRRSCNDRYGPFYFIPFSVQVSIDQIDNSNHRTCRGCIMWPHTVVAIVIPITITVSARQWHLGGLTGYSRLRNTVFCEMEEA